MAAEGEFPKIDGDILYASEVNEFQGGGKFINAGSFGPVTSGAGFTEIGSFIISGGLIGTPALINITYEADALGPGLVSLQTQISGVSANATAATNNGFTFTDIGGNIKILMGSPFIGNIIAKSLAGGEGAGELGTKVRVSNLDTRVSSIVTFSTKINDVGSPIIYFHATGEGDGD